MDRCAEGPVRHATRFVFLGGLVEHAHPAARVALLGAYDRADVVAELLVFGEARRRSCEDPIRHVGFTTEQCEMGVILRGAGRALPREAITVGDLAALHSRACEAKAGVPPDG